MLFPAAKKDVFLRRMKQLASKSDSKATTAPKLVKVKGNSNIYLFDGLVEET